MAQRPIGKVLIDTNVLIAFSVGYSMDVLEQRLSGKAFITDAVHGELVGLTFHKRSYSLRRAARGALEQLEWLGDPIGTKNVLEDVRRVQHLLLDGKWDSGYGTRAAAHYGEATLLAIARHLHAVLISDDRGAQRVARRIGTRRPVSSLELLRMMAHEAGAPGDDKFEKFRVVNAQLVAGMNAISRERGMPGFSYARDVTREWFDRKPERRLALRPSES